MTSDDLKNEQSKRLKMFLYLILSKKNLLFSYVYFLLEGYYFTPGIEELRRMPIKKYVHPARRYRENRRQTLRTLANPVWRRVIERRTQSINRLKYQLERKERENLGLSDKIDCKMFERDNIETENREMKEKLSESENEKSSLINLVDLSNNLVVNYENLIANYRKHLVSSKEESKALKDSSDLLEKSLKEMEKEKLELQCKIDKLNKALEEELNEKKVFMRFFEATKSVNEQNNDFIQYLEN